MNKKGTILCTAILLSSSMVFAADSDTTGQSDGTSTTTNTSNGDTPTSTPSSTNATDPGSTGGTSTNSNAGSSTDSVTPSTDSQGSQTSTPTNSNDTTSTNVNGTTNVTTDINVDANVTEVNNKVTIQGVTTAPTFTNVELRDNVYYIPDTVTPVGGFYFLNIDSTERVCSLQQITKIKVLSTPTTTTVMIGDKKQVLYCYDRSYFNF